MRTSLSIGLVVSVLLSIAVGVQAQETYGHFWVSQTDGIHPDGIGLYCGDTVMFEISLENNDDFPMAGFEFPLHLTPQGSGTVSYSQVDWVDLPQISSWFGLFQAIDVCTSGPADSFSVSAQRMIGGMPAGASTGLVRYYVIVDCDAVGQTVCFDTTHHRCGCNQCPLHVVRGTSPAEGALPSWEGGGCYEVRPCCYQKRGDVNQDGAIADNVDLAFLVDYLFNDGYAPECDEAADWNNDGVAGDGLDLAAHVDYHWSGTGPPTPPDCGD